MSVSQTYSSSTRLNVSMKLRNEQGKVIWKDERTEPTLLIEQYALYLTEK